jgi:cytochrome c556
MRWLLFVAVGLALQFACWDLRAADPADPVVESLRSALTKNIAHARQWLSAKDFKSLGQTAGGLELLSEVLRARSDDPPWQAASRQVVEAAQSVRSAAGAEDAEASTAALARLDEAAQAAAALSPAGTPLAAPKGNFRSLMLLMDTVRGEAKIALIAGNAENAKNQAYVLSELGRVVSNSRSGERWSKMSEEFTAASLAAARSSSTEAADLRPLFKVVSQRCDACHDTR